MYRDGHAGLALLMFAPAAFVLAELELWSLVLFGGAGIVFTSDTPDWDLRVSWIEHRGPTHTLWFALLVGIATAAVAVALTLRGIPSMLVTVTGERLVVQDRTLALAGSGLFGFTVGVVGVVSHLLGDVITPAGVPLLHPVTANRYSVAITTAGSPRANRVLATAGSLSVLAALYATRRVDVLIV